IWLCGLKRLPCQNLVSVISLDPIDPSPFNTVPDLRPVILTEYFGLDFDPSPVEGEADLRSYILGINLHRMWSHVIDPAVESERRAPLGHQSDLLAGCGAYCAKDLGRIVNNDLALHFRSTDLACK